MPLTILCEDNHCLAVVKPAPLLTQAPAGLPSLEALVRDYIKEKYHKPGRVYLGVPHRLDRPVSGVILFARSSKAARRLAEQFEKHQVTKVYWAAVEGDVQPAEGTWEDWLRKVPDQPRAERTEPHAPGARRAVLYYRRLASGRDCTLLEILLQTGRMHQVRVQAAARGWPICGDLMYGARRLFGPRTTGADGSPGSAGASPSQLARASPSQPAGASPSRSPRDQVIALHARRLTFLHPIHYEPITLTAPLPSYWHELGLPPEDRIGTDPA